MNDRVSHDVVDELYLSKSKNLKLNIFRVKNKQSIKEWIPITSTNKDGFQADLLFFPDYAKYNDSIACILVIINILSRFIYVYPLKKKSDTFEAIQKFVNSHPNLNLFESDQGSEFINKKITSLLSEKDVELYSSTNKFHVGIVERVNRTLRNLITRFITLNDNNWYVNRFQDIVNVYNKSVNRTTGKIPIDVVGKSNYCEIIHDN